MKLKLKKNRITIDAGTFTETPQNMNLTLRTGLKNLPPSKSRMNELYTG
jgi:hypothetical protein